MDQNKKNSTLFSMIVYRARKSKKNFATFPNLPNHESILLGFRKLQLGWKILPCLLKIQALYFNFINKNIEIFTDLFVSSNRIFDAAVKLKFLSPVRNSFVKS